MSFTLRVGDRVLHRDYGLATVVRIGRTHFDNGPNPETDLVVEFDEGTKGALKGHKCGGWVPSGRGWHTSTYLAKPIYANHISIKPNS